MNLGYLREQGYDYEFWRVGSQNGDKEIVAASDGQKILTNAERLTFYLPTEWTLMIQPIRGWTSPQLRALLYAGAPIMTVLLIICAFSIYLFHRQRKLQSNADRHDFETGLYNRIGFCENLQEKIERGQSGYTLFLFVTDEYSRLARLMDAQRRAEYWKFVLNRFRDYVYSSHIVGRLGESCFAVAVFESMTEQDAGELARGLSLELLWKTELDGERDYIHAEWYFVRSPEDGVDPDQLIASAMRAYEEKRVKS